MPKIILIQPLFRNPDLDRNIKTVYPLGLGYLASYISDNWEVSIIDEQFGHIDYENTAADAVGISVTTLTANRSYEIAGIFRKRGIKVIMGGVHPSILPDEALRYADAVCIGDGEKVIARMLIDIENGSLKKTYHGGLEPLTDLKPPRRDLFAEGYSLMPVSTSRGCPFKCSFCVINKFYRHTYRLRDVDSVINEISGLSSINPVIFFSDGNIYGYSPDEINRFKALCRELYRNKKNGSIKYRALMGYVSINALNDDEALELASKAGFRAFFVGFESINTDSLKDMNKTLNLKYGADSYPSLVKNARKHKIAVVGEMIVGSDSDTQGVLKNTGEFIKKIQFDILRLQILQPLPGTVLFESLEKEGRLNLKTFPKDWALLEKDFVMGVHFKLKNLDGEYLKKWVKKTGKSFYHPFRIFLRTIKAFILHRDIVLSVTVLISSFKSRKTYKNA